MVRFDEKEVEKLLTKGKNTLFITGEMTDGPFMGSDTIKVK